MIVINKGIVVKTIIEIYLFYIINAKWIKVIEYNGKINIVLKN